MEDSEEQKQSQPIGEDDENEIVAESAAFVHGDPPQNGDGPPKVDSEVEVLHEKVTKQIIKDGHDQKPSKYSTCFLHYRAWTESTQHKFDDTWLEQRPTEMVIGKDSKKRLSIRLEANGSRYLQAYLKDLDSKWDGMI
ncbi:peptidyl-prolyl cis-trans isomerase FKBP42-like [Mercurialis annua]|uniref:peptidyl-prolyl cis-trans isomerase FKBP42-like n=1 Tax=Mercurialis annua TaxID=3986 RepID=UPI0024AF75C0|nr:peptidyl-prolyl cis-trans isomerase FKBP42-like [Mercurialis annua]XP_055959862.1 peptidyl-prolyl cis-trans isomerase FKBP42-like [Mercurialis annua]